MGGLKSYFIRHTKVLAVSDSAINEIWGENKVAIHFPGWGKEDSKSIKEGDYEKRGERRAIKCFRELDKDGGYVWAEYRTQPNVKIGRIKPKSLDYFETTWSKASDKHRRRKGDKAILKTLQMQNVKILKRYEAMELRATRPRQGTITKWNIGKRLEHYVKGTPIDKNWKGLSSAQQETVCAEYLRSPDLEECPKLDFLLLPIGRTLEDVDIYGCAANGKKIFAQVTNYDKDSKACKQKIEKLERYYPKENYLVFFCNCKGVEKEDDVLFIPVTKVFEWLKKNDKYFKKIFQRTKD